MKRNSPPGKSLRHAFAIQVIDRIRTNDCIELGGSKKEPSHIAGPDGRALRGAAAFRSDNSLAPGLAPVPKCRLYESPNRSSATSVLCGRALRTMMEDRPVPAPRSNTRPAPDASKLSVGNEARPF